MSPAGTMAERFPLVFTQRRVLPLAILVAGVGAVVSESVWARLVCVAVAMVTLVAAWLQGRARPALILDEDGYAVEEHGREKLRVKWSEVVHVRVDGAEHALYVDVGDASRNLLVPPRRGYGFRFANAERLFRRVLAQVPEEKVEAVTRLEQSPPTK
jgi:hypothetical protein